MKRLLLLATSLILLATVNLKAQSVPNLSTIYVDAEAAGSNEGTSWNDAVTDLNVALNMAASIIAEHASYPEIWVAAGTYYGDGTSTNAFVMAEGVNVYGGFAGTETSLEQRNYEANVTILDGQGTQRVLYQDKAYTEATATVWDGFTIQNGGGAYDGAGAYILAYSTLRNCKITSNGTVTLSTTTAVYGGGVYVDGGTLDNCKVYGNSLKNDKGGSLRGAGVYMKAGHILDCEINNNVNNSDSHYSYSFGGGLYVENQATNNVSKVENCYIHDNSSVGYAGGIYVYGNSSNRVNVINSRIENNTSDYIGGGMYIKGYVDMIGCNIANNTATSEAGGGYLSYYTNIVNCNIVNNYTTSTSSSVTGGLYLGTSNTTKVTNTIVWGNKRGDGSASNLSESANPIVSYSAIEGGRAGTANITISSSNTGDGDALYPKFSSPSEGAGNGYSGGDWTLQEGSAIINKGVNEITGITLPENDLAGNTRIQKEKVDIGAYETSFNSAFEIVPSANNIIYVTATGAGLKNGSSWENATPYLSVALLEASAMATKPTIWVAEGTYKGDGISASAFTMAEGVNVYGGFAGTETSLEQRDYETNVTILDGQNSQRVLCQDNAFTKETVWDGFTIQNGGGNIYAGRGAWIKDYGTLRNCVIKNNGSETLSTTTEIKGGGVYVEGGTMDNCKVYGNVLKNDKSGNLRGAGVYMTYGRIVDCEIYGNENYSNYSSSYSQGGGLYISKGNNDKTSVVENTYVHDNSSRGNGGGMYVAGQNSNRRANIINSRIENNVSLSENGGGLYLGNYVNVVGCNIANNKSTSYGGGIYASSNNNIINCNIVKNTSAFGDGIYGNPTVTNCIIWGNGDEQIYSTSSTSYVTYCAVQGGYVGTGNINLSALNTGDGDALCPKFSSPTEGVGPDYSGGDWTIQEGSAAINKGKTEGLSVTLPEKDLAGNTRIQNGKIDIGAYETSFNSAFDIVPSTNNIIYVTTTGAGLKNGSSWENATPYLNIALSETSTMATKPTVWVAAGTYKGDGVSASAFTMAEGVNVYGGFAGTETSLEQRDYETNVTILDGQGTQRVLYQDKAYTTATVWDGFTIQNGGGANNGAGAYILAYSTLRNCKITNNGRTLSTSNAIYGGGAYVDGGALENCEISDNSIINTSSSNIYGGGVYMRNGYILNCEICNNETDGSNTSSVYSGGVYIENRSSSSIAKIENSYIHNNVTSGTGGGLYVAPNNTNYVTDVINCRIENNLAGNYGGGVYMAYSVNMVGCNIANNTSTNGGGGVYISSTKNKITNCNIVNNYLTGTSSIYKGAGIYYGSAPTITNSIIWGNKKGTASNQIEGNTSTSYITYSAIEGGYAGTGNINLSADNTGTSTESSYPMFSSPSEGAGHEYSGGNWTLLEGSACVDNGINEITGVTIPEKDLAGNDRIYNDKKIDIGAYESAFEGLFITPDANNIIYVATEESGEANGSSWANATSNLQMAINRAATFAVKPQVWVKAGTYGNEEEGEHYITIAEGVEIYGGFAGTETALEQRDLSANQTILDGKNKKRVLYQANDFKENTTAVIDGFVIQNGKSSGGGAGVLLRDYAIIRNCIIRNNTATAYESALRAIGYVEVINCLIADNNSSGGNGYAVRLSENSLFVNNTVVNNINTSSSSSAAVYIDNSNVRIYNSIIWGNKAYGTPNNLTVSNTVDIKNTAIEGGYNGIGIINLNSENTGDNGFYPCFTNPENGDYTLTENSICINKGSSTVYELPTTDLNSNERVQQGAVDLGAYESAYVPTLNITPDANNIIYVTTTGAGSKDGSSWANAVNNLQLAIDLANIYGAKVWVKGGVYQSNANTNYAFRLAPSVEVYGGFAGNESHGYDLSQRDFITNATILDGGGTKRVLHQESDFTETTAALWDGFTVRNGYDNESNKAAGAYIQDYVTLRNFIIYDNVSENGYAAGIMVDANSHSLIDNSVIRDNKNYASTYAGGAYIRYAKITNTKIYNNETKGEGGGLYLGASTMVNCLVSNNKARLYSGVEASSGVIVNSTIVKNSSEYNYNNTYPAAYLNSSTVVNSIIWGNTHNGEYAQLGTGNSINVTYSAIQGGWAGEGNINIEVDNDGNVQDANYIRFLDGANNIFELKDNSVAVDAGNNENANVTDYDLNGKQRINGATIDMGAFEQHCVEYEHIYKNLAQGGSVSFYGSVITEPGQYQKRWALDATCDSLVVMDVRVNSSVIYVTATGAGSKDGSSWDNAMDNINDAVIVAFNQSGVDSRQVWVAAGTYSGYNSSTRFPMVSGVEVYGGFAGTETLFSERDVENNKTILDGANSYNVLDKSTDNPATAENPAIWDGFCINGYNAVINNHCILRNSEITVKTEVNGGMVQNCTITNLQSGKNFKVKASSIVKGCRFFDNSSSSIPLIELNNAVLDSCFVYDNSATRNLIKATASNIEKTHIYKNTSKYSMIDATETNITNSLIFNNAVNGSISGFLAIVYAKDNSAIINSNLMNNMVTYTGGGDMTKLDNDEEHYWQYKNVIVALESSDMKNSVVWNNAISSFDNNFIAKDKNSNVDYCAVDGALYNGVGNIRITDANESGLFSPRFANPITDLGSVFSQETYDWSLKANSILFGHADDGKAIGAMASDAASVMTLNPTDGVIYVSAEGAGLQDGSSWSNATPYLQYAVAQANTFNPIAEVWVQAGTYYGDNVVGNNAFNIVEGVNVYGGFAGTETSIEDRDLENNKSILDGQNTQRVLFQNEPFADGETTTWDGFVIRNGYLNQKDFHSYNSVYCKFNGFNGGMGIYHLVGAGAVVLDNTTLKNITFENNRIDTDASIGSYVDWMMASTLAMVGVTADNINISNAVAYTTNKNNVKSSYLYVANSTITNSTFKNNVGKIQTCSSTLDYCVIEGNRTFEEMPDKENNLVTIFENLATTVKNTKIISNKGATLLKTNVNGVQYANTYINTIIADNEGYTIVNHSLTNGDKFVNCNIVRNKISTDRMISGGEFHNTVVWNNRNYLGVSSDFDRNNLDKYSFNNCAVELGLDGIDEVIALAPSNSGTSQAYAYANFISPEGNDYELADNSALIDAGDNTVVTEEFDVYGKERIGDGTVDIGAIESSCVLKREYKVVTMLKEYPFYGEWLTEPGTYIHRKEAKNDCDSVIVMHLTFKRLVYVNAEAKGLNNGTSWENAYTDLKMACDSLEDNGNMTEMWVAKGRYRGDGTSVNAFILKPNTRIYGGFTGTELADYDITQRDITANETILDGGYIQRVICMEKDATEETPVIIDGFTITKGFSRQGVYSGTALYVKQYCYVSNCIITDNCTNSGVGPIHIDAANFENCNIRKYINTFENCDIHHNQGSKVIHSENTLFQNCKIENNDGLGIEVSSYTKLDGCSISNNKGRAIFVKFGGEVFADEFGYEKIAISYQDVYNTIIDGNAGGIYHEDPGLMGGWGDGRYYNTIISNNRVAKVVEKQEDGNGGAFRTLGGKVSLYNCNIVNNSAKVSGGGLYGRFDEVINTIIYGNRANGEVSNLSNYYYFYDVDMQILKTWQGLSDLRYCAVEAGYPGEGNISLNRDYPLSINGNSLTSNSSCINAGTDALYDLTEYDIKGKSRVRQGRIDIGVHESDYSKEDIITPDANNVIYVDVTAKGRKDGSSWDNATADVQTAINYAAAMDPRPEIWMKKGVYTMPDNEAWAMFTIVPGTKIYGGFSGDENPATFNKNDRELFDNKTVLDAKNLLRAIDHYTATDDYEMSVIDGFTIKNGNAEPIYTKRIPSSITSYPSEYVGGAIKLKDNVTVTNCELYNNVADKGGAIYANNSSDNMNIVISNSKLHDNYAHEEGGAIVMSRTYIYQNTQLDNIINCEISNNKSDRFAGLNINWTKVINSTIVGNNTEMYAFDTLTSTNHNNSYYNCILWNNVSRNYSNQIEGYDNTYEYCAIHGGYTGEGNITLDKYNSGTEEGVNYVNFIDPEGRAYQPQNTSAVIDKGNNAYSVGEFDLAGKDRIYNEIVDMGAYEGGCINYKHMKVIANEKYEFYGDTLRESGHYSKQWTPEGAECDSLVTLDLEVRLIWYVSVTGDGKKDGSSWNDAMSDIQAAINKAAATQSEAKKQVWVAKGTYMGNGSSAQAFQIKPGVEIYGGFVGDELNGIEFEDRDLVTNETILSGAQSQRVLGNYNAHSSFNVNDNAVIDGFTIQEGYTPKEGGGIYVKNFVKVRNCIIRNNQGGDGAGIYADNKCEITDCKIYGNVALSKGGGAFCKSSILTYCEINNNLIDNLTGSAKQGGGIYGENATINNCLIANNSVLTESSYGGGMYIGNSALPSQLLNCTMVNNFSYYLGGGVYSVNSGSNNEFINCIMWGNKTDLNTQQVAVSASNVPIYVRYCAIQGGAAGIGTINLTAENGNDMFSPRFVNPTEQVGANYWGGDWRIKEGSICINMGERLEYMIEQDLDDEKRVKQDRIDIGAYETNGTNSFRVYPDGNNIIYVKKDNAGSDMTGSSWNNAINDLQLALNFAADDDNHPKVWIAKGTYTGNGWPYVDAFIGLNGIDIYGGFAGNEAHDYDLSQRDLVNNATVLDGQNIQRTLHQAHNTHFKYSLDPMHYAIYDGLVIRNGFVYHNYGGNVVMRKGELRNSIIENGASILGSMNDGFDSGIGGAGILGTSSDITVINSVIRNNKATNAKGGGYYGPVTFVNCIINNNSATVEEQYGNGYAYGGAGASSDDARYPRAKHYNSTIVNNYAHSGVGGISNYDIVYNSILWGNKIDGNITSNLKLTDVVGNISYGRTEVYYSAVEGGCVGKGNITLNKDNSGSDDVNYPMFVNPTIAAGAGNYGAGDWRLQDGSVCVNRGTTTAQMTDTDLDGNPRIVNDIVDMGAYESNFGINHEIIPDANDIVYVTTTGAGTKDGSSWANATPYLQFAMDRIYQYERPIKFWIAKGTYKGNGVASNSAFIMTDNVSLYGGFAGNEEANFDLSLRDFETNETVFDGQNLQQVLARDLDLHSSNSRNRIDGITIKNGRFTEEGAGARLNNVDVYHSTFTNNTNLSEVSGGGGALYTSNVAIYHSKFFNNYSTHDGGAIYSQGGNDIISHCLIKNNTADNYGGGIYGPSVKVYNSEISYNTADNGGGIHASSGIIVNSTIVNNNASAVSEGSNAGGIYGGNIYNSIIWGNKAGSYVSNVRGKIHNFQYSACERDEYVPSPATNIILETSNSGDDIALNYVSFIDPANGDFQLMENSDCIDKGNKDLTNQHNIDLAGNERIRGANIDMGAYEQNPTSCKMISDLSVPEDKITFTTVDVTWTSNGTEAEWLVYYDRVGENTPTLMTVDTTYITIDGLSPNLDYFVKVRAICNEIEMSPYSNPVYFTTECNPDSVVWVNYFETDNLLPENDQALQANSKVLFSWDHIEGAESYELWLWRADDGHGLPIPDFPVAYNIKNNYHTVDLRASVYQGYGKYPRSLSKPEPPGYLEQTPEEDIAYYAWKVVAYRECATIETDTMYFNTALSDLHITAMDCSYAQTGQPMTVEWTVRNDGHGPTPVGETWYDYIVLSYPIDWTSESFTQVPYESFIIDRVENLTALQVGESYTNTATITVPDDMYGAVFLFVLSNWNPNAGLSLNFAQYGGVFPNPYTPNLYGDGKPYGFMSGNNSKAGNASFEEINGVDNFFYKAIEVDIPPIPDMVASNVIVPYEHFAGDSITISWQITNQGGAAFENIHVTDNVYMSTKDVFDADAVMIGSYSSFISMERDETITRTAYLPTNAGDCYSSFYFFVETDVRNQIYESLFEDNNVSPASEHSTYFMLVPPADLEVSYLYSDNYYYSPNENVKLSYNVANVGYKNTADYNINKIYDLDTCDAVPTSGKQWKDVAYISKSSVFNIDECEKMGTRYNGKTLWTESERGTIEYWLEINAYCMYPDPKYPSEPEYSDNPDIAAGQYENYQKAIEEYYKKMAQAEENREKRCEKLLADTYINKYTAELEFTIPENYDKGTYYIHVVTDQGDNIFEYDYNDNNITTIEIEVVVPDLVVENVALNEDRDAVSYTVTNIGNGKVIDGLLTTVVNYNNSEIKHVVDDEINLDSGESLDFTIPVDLECNFYTDNTIKVETRLIYPESTYTNNSQTIDLQLFNPDFFVEELVIPGTQLGSGETYELSYTITNNGDVDFNDKVNIKYYLGLSPELNFITAEELLSKNEILELAVGETDTITENITLPISADGIYYFYVSVNDDEEICEGDNTYNNYLVSERLDVSLSPYPDLVVTQVSMPDNAVAGGSIAFSYTVENQGIRNTYNTERWTDKIYLSSEPQFNINNAILIGKVNRGGMLEVNSLYTETVNVSVPANITTAQYVYIVTDADDGIYEFVGENNNLYQCPILNVDVYNCDLAATSISCPDNLQWGSSVNFTYTVANKGTKSTTESYSNGIYLSTDEMLDAGDIKLETVLGSKLSGGASKSGSISAKIPYGFTGNAYILLVADHEGKNPDVNRTNNVISRAVNVENVPVPDLAISGVTLVTEYPAAGQPIRIAYTVTNIGDGEAESWKDKVSYSRNTLKNATLSHNIARNTALAPGQSYNDTTEVIIPLPNTGNFAIYIEVNPVIDKNDNHAFFEMNYENNLGMQSVNVDFNPPGDIVIENISHRDVVESGDDMEIRYRLKNLGPNKLEGQGCNDVLYLSTDQTFSPDDILLGNIDHNIVLPNYSYEEYSFTAHISGIPEGEYFIIIYGDARNSFYEVDENNNRGYSAYPFEVKVPELFFDTPVTFKLKDLVHKDFKLNIYGNINETVRIHVSSPDSEKGAVNNIYVKHNNMGSNMDYDFSTDGDMDGDAEVYIPTTRAGYYGISVMGEDPIDDEQMVTIEANILPFEIRSVESNVAGNTGKVTVKLIGSKFRHDMPVRLFMGNPADSTMYNIIEAEELYYINFNEVCVTFDLTRAEEGVYSIEAFNYCAGYTYLMNSFMVEAGKPEHLSTNLIIPEGLRQNRYCILTLEYGNTGNTDIVDPKIKLCSIGGSWIGLERGEINVHRTELDIPIGMEGEPEGILRPGVRYTVSIYCFTNQSLEFVIYSNDDVYQYEQLRDEIK